MSKGSPVVGVRLSPEQHKQLLALADSRKIPVSDVIREAIRAYLDEKKPQ
jgi:predicted DNA-binding protein